MPPMQQELGGRPVVVDRPFQPSPRCSGADRQRSSVGREAATTEHPVLIQLVGGSGGQFGVLGHHLAAFDQVAAEPFHGGFVDVLVFRLGFGFIFVEHALEYHPDTPP